MTMYLATLRVEVVIAVLQLWVQVDGRSGGCSSQWIPCLRCDHTGDYRSDSKFGQQCSIMADECEGSNDTVLRATSLSYHRCQRSRITAVCGECEM